MSNDRGVIAAAAMDQRGSLQKSLAKEKGGEVSSAMMEEFKSLVTEVLTPMPAQFCLILNVDCRLQSGAPRMPACCWPTRRPAMTRPAPAASATCWTIGRYAV